MKIVKNEKYVVIELLPQELQHLQWGNVCCQCNGTIGEPVYYIPVLHDLMCKECMEKWYDESPYYPEDEPYQTNAIKGLIENLKGLTYEKDQSSP